MDLQSVLNICKAWTKLGWSIQEQAETVLQGNDLNVLVEEGSLNPNALRYIREFLEVVEDGWQSETSEEDWDFVTETIHKIEEF